MSPVVDAIRFSALGRPLLRWLGWMHGNRRRQGMRSRLEVGVALCHMLELGNDELPWPPTLGRRSQTLVGRL
jgi:hypothetical protein